MLENVTLGNRLRGTRIDTQRAQYLLQQVGLGEVLSAYPAQLSGGMRQRVALARTLMEDQPVVLMDEPFSSLDALTRRRLQTLTITLLAGRTVLLVTHDPLEALRMSDHILVMRGRPATLSALPELPGAVPRDPSNAAVQSAYRDLLALLEAL